MSVVIERIRQEHSAGLQRVYDMVSRERKYLSALEGHSLERTSQFVATNIAKGYPQYVAVSGGDVVGWCDMIPMSLPTQAHAATLGMGLLPEFRGRGIGLALLEAVLQDARRLRLVRIELTVHADNLRALGLYKRVGFQIEGVKKDAVLIDGAYKDLVIMALVDHSASIAPR
jgi:RimJ/RimL family protein N-acetyltransferase